MKILSIAVPCYNSEAYMEKCIDSLLVGGEEVEILIVDDGSKDGRLQTAIRKISDDCKSDSSGKQGPRRSSQHGCGKCDGSVLCCCG